MQPEPSTVSSKSSFEEHVPETNPQVQHGSHDADQQPPPLFHSRERGESDASSYSSQFEANSQSSQSDDASAAASRNRRINASKTPSPSPGNRISRYENAIVTPPRLKSDGPAFEVIKTNRKPGDKISPVAQLPNGGTSVINGMNKANLCLQRF